MDAFPPDPGEKESPRLSLRGNDDRFVTHGSCLKKKKKSIYYISLVLKVYGRATALVRLFYNSEIIIIRNLLLKHQKH